MWSDDQFRKDNCSFMKERVPIDEILTTTKQVWYIPHHGGYHKKILGKKRVVFDCIALCDCQSLNQELFQGPVYWPIVYWSRAIECALGVRWCIESGTLQFRITLPDRPLSRRRILWIVSSVFDPLGFVAPFILVGKQIPQELCCDSVGWDDAVPDDLRPKWEKWRAELPILERLRVPRYYKPQEFDEVKNAELHHFLDACQNGNGQCSYMSLVDDMNCIHCSMVMGKSWVMPLKPVTTPRLKQTAAIVSSKISRMLWKEYTKIQEIF